MSMYVNGQKVAPTKSVRTTSDINLYIHSGQVNLTGGTYATAPASLIDDSPLFPDNIEELHNQSITLYFSFISKTSTQQFTDYTSFKQAIINLFNKDNEKMYNTNFVATIVIRGKVTNEDNSVVHLTYNDIGPFIKSTKSTLTIETTGYNFGYNDINFDSFPNFRITRYVINELV